MCERLDLARFILLLLFVVWAGSAFPQRAAETKPSGPDSRVQPGAKFNLSFPDLAKDRKGNTIGAGSAASLVYPDTFPPQMTGVFPYDESSVMVGFNEQVLRNQAENVSNYTLALEKDTTQTIDVMIALLSGGHRFARIVFAHRLAEGELYRLTARNIADLKGNVSPVLRRYFAFVDVYPPELVLARARGRANVDVFFSEPVDHLTGTTPSNYSVFPRGNPASPLPIAGAAMRGDSSIVRLSLGDTLVAGALYTLRVSDVEDRQHNVIAPASEIDVIPPDSIPPSIEAVRAASFNTVVVRFSEPVARFTAQDTTNYRVYAPSTPGDSPKLTGAVLLDDSATVKLSLGREIVLWRTYKVRANNIEDLASNVIAMNSEKSFVCSPLPEKGAIGLFADTQRQQSSVYLASGQITEFTMYLFSYPSQEGQRDLEFAIKYPSNVTQGVFAVNDAVVASSVGEPALGVEAHLRECNYDWIWTHRQTCYLLDSQKSTVGIVRHPAAGAYGFRSCLSGNPFESVDILTHLYCNCTYNPGTLLKEFAAGYRDECIEITWSVSQIDEGVEFSMSRTIGGGGVFTPLAAGTIEANGATFRFVDRDIEHGASYRYRVGFIDESGSHVLFETDAIETPSLRLALYQNVPNPFNPSTTIRYYVPRASTVVLEIYDVSGRRVARLADGPQREGRHEAAWDGTSDSGSPVSSGVYLCRLQTGKETLSRKMVLLR